MLVYMLLFALQLQIQQTVLSLPHLLWLYGMLLAGYIILPAITVFLLYKLRIIKSLKLDNKQDNAIAYLIFALFYYLCFQSVSFYAIYPLIQIYMLIPILITASYLIIHLFYNINAHALFIGAIIGFYRLRVLHTTKQHLDYTDIDMYQRVDVKCSNDYK